jgi:hypothetical protein
VLQLRSVGDIDPLIFKPPIFELFFEHFYSNFGLAGKVSF